MGAGEETGVEKGVGEKKKWPERTRARGAVMMAQEQEQEQEEEQAKRRDGLGPKLRMRQDGVFKMVF